MRIRLKKGYQKRLILSVKEKNKFTWGELAKKLSLSENYLKNELREEKRTISEEVYLKLCSLGLINFNRFIIEKLEENWGRSIGGKISRGNLKEINKPVINEELAEVVGIILGDGHISEFKKDKKIRCYFVRIAGNSNTDLHYISVYIPDLFHRVFGEKGKVHFSKTRNVGYFTIYGKEIVEFLGTLGLSSGNKLDNNQGIPNWIKTNKLFLKRCVRGLIDTDGSVHYISKTNLNLRISYTSYIENLLNDMRNALIELEFNPSKIISKKQIFLSRQGEIKRYLEEIGFGNEKNLNRISIFQRW